jgi:TetR/AcrR family transcriptional regulator, tetracycline repressor protein
MASAKTRSEREPLTRERVLEEALQLVDEEGLQALTMRALGKRLGVEAASLYNHVPGKRALYEGLSELLWAELEGATEPSGDWRRSIRTLADQIRRLGLEHRNAYQLLLEGRVCPLPGLRVLAAHLSVLRDAGFADDDAAGVLRAVLGYALGYAGMEHSSFSVSPAKAGANEEDAELGALLALGRTLPPDLPPELARAARMVCLADLDRQFTFGLEALLSGLEP